MRKVFGSRFGFRFGSTRFSVRFGSAFFEPLTSLESTYYFIRLGEFFLGGTVRVQIGRELVRLITLISLNKLSTNITSPKSLKKFSHTTL